MLTGELSTEQHQHHELVEIMEGLVSAVRANKPLELPKFSRADLAVHPPVVNVSTPTPIIPPAKVTVNAPESAKQCSWEFIIHRDEDDNIERVIANPLRE